MLDLLIRNGHVIDPANGVDEVRPVAVYNGKIVRYEEGENARHVIDAEGRMVFPGLIDSHAHMFAEGTDIGIYPDLAYLDLAGPDLVCPGLAGLDPVCPGLAGLDPVCPDPDRLGLVCPGPDLRAARADYTALLPDPHLILCYIR